MTITLFITILTIASTINSLVTEAVKKMIGKSNYTSPNLIAALNSVIVGCGSTILVYLYSGIPFDLPNNICIVLMSISVWLGSMVGYDKVMQLIAQIAKSGE